MHRSGSSFVTNLLQRMGMSLGPFDLLGTCEHNKYGHFEAVPIYRLDQQLLGQVFGFTEDVPDSPEILRRFCVSGGHWRLDTLPVSEQQLERGSQLVQQLVTSGCVSGFKDPRVPLLWPFWNHVFSGFAGLNIVPVFLLRSPHEIAMSLFMRSKGAIGYYDALDVTAIHYRQMNVILDSWNGEIAVVQFDPQVLMEDLRKLSKICNLAWSDEFLSQVFDANCRHHEPAVVAHPAQELFQRLSRLPIHEHNSANLERLERDEAIREAVMRNRLQGMQREITHCRHTEHENRASINELESQLTLKESQLALITGSRTWRLRERVVRANVLFRPKRASA